MMLGARAIGPREQGLSPRAGALVVDSLCPPLLSKRERCRHPQPPVLCTLCCRLSTSGWWGGHPVNTYPVGTRFGTPSALCTLSLRLLPFCSFVLCYPAVCLAWSASDLELECIPKLVIFVSDCIPGFRSVCPMCIPTFKCVYHMCIPTFSSFIVLRAQFPSPSFPCGLKAPSNGETHLCHNQPWPNGNALGCRILGRWIES